MNTWMDTREKVFAYIRGITSQAGDRVVASVLEEQTRFSLFLLLDGEGSTTDIAVVHGYGIRAETKIPGMWRRLCEEEYAFLTRAEVGTEPAWKISEEEAGRRTRYEAFEKAAKEWEPRRSQWPTTAMTRGPETQLFHLFRERGIRGLASICL